MHQTTIIQDKQKFIKEATAFFNCLFEPTLTSELGTIEIRTFRPSNQMFLKSERDAAQVSYDLCNQGIDVYVGVNPRIGGAGKKENIPYLAAFHCEVDYGVLGHKKATDYKCYEDALEAIKQFKMKPTIVNHSGGGFHLYFVLANPIKVADLGIEPLEIINKALIKKLGADGGTHDITRVLRVPGTFNFKGNQSRPVTNLWLNGPRYGFDDFEWLLADVQIQNIKEKTQVSAQNAESNNMTSQDPIDIDNLTVSPKIKNLILNGNDGTYPSRSEADQSVITALVNKGMGFSEIKAIFENNRIGEKYREHSSRDAYLKHNIERAKDFSDLTEEERQDPLFVSNTLSKNKNGGYKLNIVPFQEFMSRKFLLKFLEKENTFFRYNGQCYEQCTEMKLNEICQKELGKHRGLFTQSSKRDLIHYASAQGLLSPAYDNQVRYLTLQNGLYDLAKSELIPHTPDIFTTNLLPYNYDPEAKCPRWLQYLDEVFMGDKDTILCVQQAVGYAFHMALPTHAIFFLIGVGGNGKSVFLEVISSLCGKDNVCNISLNRLNDEKYLPELFGKMINISSETPTRKSFNNDLIKAVVAGDWVTGREVFKGPKKFKPYVKHYLGMNKLPEIDDDSDGMWRRIYVIEFPRRFSRHEMDVGLTGKLMLELSGIFNWALEGYVQLKSKAFNFSVSEKMQANKDIYKRSNNSAMDFESYCMDKTGKEKDSVPFKDVYQCYQDFCVNEGSKRIFSKKEFRKYLESEHYRIENSKKHNNQVRIFGASITPMN